MKYIKDNWLWAEEVAYSTDLTLLVLWGPIYLAHVVHLGPSIFTENLEHPHVSN
jgi:hypothetical protein